MNTVISKEEIEKNLNFYKQSMEKTKTRWDKIIPQRINSAYYGMGIEARHVAIYNLLLGNLEEGLFWFGESGEYYLKSRVKGADSEVQGVMWPLLMAVLSGDEDLINKANAAVDDLVHTTPVYFYRFVMCLSRLTQKRYNEALIEAEELDRLEPTNYSPLKYYRGLGKMSLGIIQENPKILLEGLTNIMKRHMSLIRYQGKNYDASLICIPATVLLLLAKKRGLDVKKQDLTEKFRPYIPWILFKE